MWQKEENMDNIRNTIQKITSGNEYDSRIGNHSYSAWTTGRDYCFYAVDGSKKFYQHRSYVQEVRDYEISPVTLEGEIEVALSDLPRAIQKMYFEDVLGGGTEEEFNLFAYGEKEGAKINAKNNWLDEHCIYSREITSQVLQKIGAFEKVECINPGVLYLIDGSYFVRIANEEEVSSIKTYAQEMQEREATAKRRKAYNKRLGALSRKYHMPFEACLALGDNEEVYPQLLAALKNPGHVTLATLRDLEAGIARRKEGLLAVIGEELFDSIGIYSMGQTNSNRLAHYVVNKCYEYLKK